MTKREAFEAWWDEFESANEDWRFADSSALRLAAWQAACAWQRERDAEIVAGTELLPGQSASQEYAYDFVARYLNDIAEAIRNQGVNDEPQ